MSIEGKSFAKQTGDAKAMQHTRMGADNVLRQGIMTLTLEPDWIWSADINPIVGTPSCQGTHTGVIVEGTIHCICDDGFEAHYAAGDAYEISPNHDAWCIGGKRGIFYKFSAIWGE